MGAQAIGAGLGAAGSLYSGIQQNKAAAVEATEATRTATRQASQKAEDIEDVKKSQTLDFLSSGITLEGTPLQVLEETERRGQEEIAEIKRTGKRTSDALRKSGRDALIGSVFQAGSQAAGSFS